MTAGLISYTRGEDPLRADKLNASFSERVLVAGDTMTGPLLLSRAPVVPTEAATKNYVDGLITAQGTGYLPTTGGTLTGFLTLHANPVNPLHAATKQYIDNLLTGSYLPLTGGTLTGNLVLQNNLHISGPSGTTRSLNFDNSNLTNRWLLSASAIAESGGNVGSDFGITPAADNGAFLPTAISIKRSTGLVTIGNGLTVNGSVSVGINGMAYPSVQINGATGGDRQVLFSTNGSTRWTASANSAAESGSNVGSDFAFNRFNDAGAYIGTPLYINRSNGSVSMANGLSITGGINIVDNSGNASSLNITATGTSGAGIMLVGNGATTAVKYIQVYNGYLRVVNSGYSAEILSLTDAGLLTVAGGMTVNGGPFSVGANNAISTGGQVLAGFLVTGKTGASQGGFLGSWNSSNNDYQGIWSASGALCFGFSDLAGTPNVLYGSIGKTGNLSITGGGYKPGGGVWADSSDARIKDVQGDYTRGLGEIVQLQPRNFLYCGNERLVMSELNPLTNLSPHAGVLGREFVGLVAQEVETLFPEMVTQVPALINGKEVDDLRVLDTTPLTYAMINAFKELDARLHRLETKA